MSALDRWKCRRGRHDWFVGSVDFGNYSERYCLRPDCDTPHERRPWRWGPKKAPWRVPYSAAACDHGVGGVWLPACMQCAVLYDESMR